MYEFWYDYNKVKYEEEAKLIWSRAKIYSCSIDDCSEDKKAKDTKMRVIKIKLKLKLNSKIK